MPARRRTARSHGVPPFLLAGALLLVPLSGAAAAEVQLRCEGTLLEARGSAERQRPLARLAFSLGLAAQAPTADRALGLLQSRLAVVRSALQRLGSQDLRVGSPSTWSRTAEGGRPAGVQASLPVSGKLAPERLQALIREVGALPGVRLDPVAAEADPAGAAAAREALLAAAYRDAVAQVEPLARLIGRPRLLPLQIQIDGAGAPVLMRAEASAAATPPFDPAELPLPTDRLGLQVQFCAVQNRN